MGVTSYYSFGGEIIGEETGGVRRDYLTDALGSVTATVTGAGVVENTYRYKPYGEQLAKTGNGSDPKFLWNNFRKCQIRFVDFYTKNNFYSTIIGTSISVKFRYMNSIVELNGMFCNTEGLTECDTKNKIPIITIPNGCASSCIKAHEDTHANQIKDCCVKYAECISKNRNNPSGIIDCNFKWNNWKGSNKLIFECEGYKAAVACFNIQINEQCKDISPCQYQKGCCPCYEFGADSSNSNADFFCQAAQGKQKQPCPDFNKGGGFSL